MDEDLSVNTAAMNLSYIITTSCIERSPLLADVFFFNTAQISIVFTWHIVSVY